MEQNVWLLRQSQLQIYLPNVIGRIASGYNYIETLNKKIRGCKKKKKKKKVIMS